MLLWEREIHNEGNYQNMEWMAGEEVLGCYDVIGLAPEPEASATLLYCSLLSPGLCSTLIVQF